MAVDMGAIDPWVVQPRERARYEEQFRSLNPHNGIITGDQAKGFFLQSQLPPPILGKIWALSDTDADGKMDINEFSIACKLINLKLRGFQIPSTLPPVLKSLIITSPQPITQGMTPLSGPLLPGQRPPAPVIPPQPILQSQPASATPQTPPIPPQPVVSTQPVITSQSAISTVPLIPPQPIMATTVVPSLVSIEAPSDASMTSRLSLTGNATIPQSVMAPIIQSQPVVQPGLIMTQVAPPVSIPASTTQISAVPTPVQVPATGLIADALPVASQPQPSIPQSAPLLNQTPVNTQSMAATPAVVTVGIPQTQPLANSVMTMPLTSGTSVLPQPSVVEAGRGPTTDSPSSVLASPVIEWAVPHQSKLKYTQLFNTTDRTRTGFLSGPQARNIMMQTRLRQQILAQIWALADADSDGRLNCEEFVLAMHLCDMAKEGRPIPTILPVELVPPGMRRKRGSSLSISDEKQESLSAIQNSVTFEDKRKENFDKGQAELERRRAALLEAQRKEQEERERKEREEQERREQLRAEQEARRQQELQKQLERQRELEQEQEEQRRRATEQREAARKEVERQRQQEWEKARTQELEAQRMKEQDNVLRLKARNQALAIELATLTGKVKELSTKISETRTGVSGVKSTIDGMRVTRDTHMSEMASLKNKLKEQNQRLLLLTQEKAKLEARNKVTAAADAAATEQVRLAFTNKQITIKHLNEKVADLQNEVKSKTEDVENNNIQLKDLKNQLKDLVNECESLYTTYSEKRDGILQLKAAKGGSTAWGGSVTTWETGDSWDVPAATDSWGAAPAAAAPAGGQRKYRAIYAFQSRNPDELSFEPGDIIMVPVDQNAEPGWLAGELRGATGWFPESYVEPLDQANDISSAGDITSNQNKQQLEGILEVPESVAEKTVIEGISELYVAVYPYQSSELGDLSFDQGETITVIKKDGDWWTGIIGERSGLFPSNYVQKAETKEETITSEVSQAPVAGGGADSAAEDDSVFLQTNTEDSKRDLAKSPVVASTTVSGRATPADLEQTKPVTPDFSAITPAQTKIGKKGEIATVIAPYQATSSEQLSLARGQLVCIRKKTTTGWWEGELQAKGKKKQVGWFPASYVKIMSSRRLSQTTPDFEAEQNSEKVIAMFPYKALNDDELSFEKDDIITVLAREETAWWRGELKGTTGLFPSNYVMPYFDNPLAPKLDSKEKLRQEAIQELLDSERAYTNDMAVVRQVFEKPLLRSGLVTREQMGKIFLNWREILRGNHALLKLLEERKRQSANGVIECIGDILSDNLPKMGAYVRFCSCQLSAGVLLQELTDSSSAFRALCRQCQSDPRTQGLPLSTFLVKPMQRITKYPLLISKVLEQTPKNHPDRPLLEEALARAEELCSQVNEGVRETENAERLEWLQSHIILEGLEEPLVFNSVTNSAGPRKFLFYGVLTKVRSGRELVGFLLSDILVLAQPLKPLVNSQFSLDRSTSLTFKLYKKPLLVKDMTAQKSTESGDRTINITLPKGQYPFFANSSAEANQWVKHISVAHQKCENLESKHHLSRFPRIESGRTVGRLLVEVVEALNLETKSCLCEVRLGNQVQYTSALSSPYKWNTSMQFLLRDISNDVLTVGLVSKNEFRPDDFLDRNEIRVNEIMQKTRSGVPVLRKLALRQLGTAEILLKLDLVLFNFAVEESLEDKSHGVDASKIIGQDASDAKVVEIQDSKKIKSAGIEYKHPLELRRNLECSKWSVLLENRLSELLIAVTHIDSGRMLYKTDSSIDLYKVDGEKILKRVLGKMTDLWQRKKTALKRLVNKAEENVVIYNRNYGSSMLTLEDVPFFNVKSVPPTVQLTFSPRFRQKVSFEQSGVHIPLEVFDGWMGPRYKEAWWHDPEMLNGLNWTSSLDEVFKENWKQDPTLRWQYFGSYFGFMRVYPSFRWPDHPSLPDLFDVRRRTWYIQGSVSPKDVVILIDRSGSVHGQTLDIMKITVRALLNSLGENDYVNVAWFNNKVSWVVPCLDSLLQATAQIRRLLSDAVERLTESNLTSYTAALDFAFDAFRKFDEKRKPWAGSNCQKIIMFLSDGGTEWPSDLVTKHCNESRDGRIRIFTFACGPHPIPTVVLKEMACSTGGYFSPITALGSVRVKVQDYVRVLSKPLSLSEDDDLFQWHNFYRDIGGLGMMTTITLPVFNKSNVSSVNHLLGVMGIDVPIEEMTDLFPKHELGLFGYPFAINTNGFVIFHPRLKDHIVYIEDPPDVDLTDLEGISEEIFDMRNNMVDGRKGSLKKFNSVIPVGLGHAIPVEMDYYYDSVESSAFRFGLALPSDLTSAKVKLTDSEVQFATALLSQMENTILAPWRFCPFEEADEELNPRELADRIVNNYTTCVPDLVHHLLWDVGKANAIQGMWKQNTLSGIWTRFLITSSGLTTIHTSGFSHDYLRQRDPLKNNLYKRAAHKKGCVLSVARGRSQEVTAACRIVLKDSFVAAVIGAEMEQSQIQSIFEEVTGIGGDVNCKSSDSLVCYLLNDGGIIIASNQEDAMPGDFIGVHDPELLENLITGGMLKREYRYNYLSWCSKDSNHVVTQSAPRPTALFSFIFHAISGWDWNLLYNFILYFISSFSIGKAECKVTANDFGNHSCVTRSTWYYHTGSASHSGAFTCDSYRRGFQSFFLRNVTLIFVIAEPPCDNAYTPPIQNLDPQEDVGPYHCSRHELYRIRPEKCYSTMPKDGFEDCGADSGSFKVSSENTRYLIFGIYILQILSKILTAIFEYASRR